MRKRDLEKIWKLLDGACDALERMTYDDELFKLLEAHERHVDFSAIVSLKNDVEELIKEKARPRIKPEEITIGGEKNDKI
jgi:hypothetical protein